MVAANPNSSVLHLAGLGIPLIDFITPKPEEFDAGEKLIAAAQEQLATGEHKPLEAGQKEQLAQMFADGPSKIACARQSLEAFSAFVQQKKAQATQGNGKNTLDEEETERVAAWFEDMLAAARVINKAAVLLERPEEELMIRHIGGSMTNKFHVIKSGMGDRVEAHLLGATGDEDKSGNHERLLNKLAETGIDFQQFENISLGNMAIGYIFPENHDRVAFKSHIKNLVEKLVDRHEEIDRLITEPVPDAFFIEGGDFSSQKFGVPTFEYFATAAMSAGEKHGSEIVLAAPTDLKLILGDTEAAAEGRRRIDTLIDHPSTTVLTFNESEALATLCNEAMPKKIEGPLRDYEGVTRVVNLLQERLKQKEAQMAPGSVEPVAFMTVGKEGAFYITSRGWDFVKGAEAKEVVTIGAGDAFVGGAFVERARILNTMKDRAPEGGLVRFTQEELESMTQRGQQLGRETVGIKGAQLPPARIAELFHGAVPAVGELCAIQQPVVEKERFV